MNYSSLTDKEQEILNSILKYFYFTKIGISSLIVYRLPELQALEKADFIQIEQSPKLILSNVILKFKMDYLKKIYKDHITEAKVWVKERRAAKEQTADKEDDAVNTGKKKADMYRSELIEWILLFNPPIADDFWNDLTIISIPSDESFTLGEWFHNNLLPNVSSFPALKLPAESDPRFLKSPKS